MFWFGSKRHVVQCLLVVFQVSGMQKRTIKKNCDDCTPGKSLYSPLKLYRFL